MLARRLVGWSGAVLALLTPLGCSGVVLALLTPLGRSVLRGAP